MDEEASGCDIKVRDAAEVYLLMNDKYRISRNSRAAWYFSHLNHVIALGEPCSHKTEAKSGDGAPTEAAQEFTLLSIVPKDGGHHGQRYRVTPSTKVIFIAQKYRLAFVLDISPSVASIDALSTKVIFDEVFSSLSATLKSIVEPFITPGGDSLCYPKIFVTVIAHTSLLNCNTNSVLLQGCLVTPDNLDGILQNVKSQLAFFENCVAKSLGEILSKDDFEQDEDDQRLTGGLFEDIIERPESPDASMHVMTPEACFVNMLRCGILALHLLPDHASAGIIVLTDGVVSLPDVVLFESLMMQLRHSSIACSFIQLSSMLSATSPGTTPLGHVPYPDLLQFMAAATFGAFFSQPTAPQLVEEGHGMNAYHKALLSWDFLKALGRANSTHLQSVQELPWARRVPGSEMMQWTPALGRKKLLETNASIYHLISCRLREGYTIKDVNVSKNDSQLEVKMVLPWRDGVNIQYLVVSAWPVNPAKHSSQVEVSVEAGYEFRRDVAFTTKKDQFHSSFRTAVVKKFWQTLNNMLETDRLLVHLQSFNTNPIYYKVPECVKKGVPLFCTSASSSNPQPNTQLSTRDMMQFASFWKPALMLDVSIWQKWLHSHRIGMVLEHDMPHVPRHLHIPNSSGRFHSVSCRQSLTALQVALQQWSSFVLMDNHTYVALHFQDADKPPTSFHLIRLSSKPPCMILRIAFIGGTPGKERNKVMKELRERLESLRFAGGQVDDKNKAAIKIQRKPSVPELHDAAPPASIATSQVKERKPPLQREAADKTCCKILVKPVEKILIRYDRLPVDFLSLELPPSLDQSGGHLQSHSFTSANRIGYSNFSILSRYLFHQRWIWSVQYGASLAISTQATGNILSNLTKIRLQEGFNIAQTQSGIVSLIAEVKMKREVGTSCGESPDEEFYPCVVQYLVFPPHTTTSKESVCEEDGDEDLGEMETAEADGELQVITECWVEPQYGTVVDSPPERRHLDGLTYRQIPHAMYPRDIECISALITFEHLNLMCQSASVLPPHIPRSPLLSSSPEGKFTYAHYQQEPSVIQHIPFPFDLLAILPKCQQVELLFSTLILHECGEEEDTQHSTLTRGTHNPSPPSMVDESNKLLYSLLLDEIGGVHSREVNLTEEMSEQFLHLVSQRKRDTEKHPLPFTTAHLNSILREDEDKLNSILSPSATSVSAHSVQTVPSVVSSAAQTRPQSLVSVASITTVSSQQSQTKLSVMAGYSSRTASPLNVNKDFEGEANKGLDLLSKTGNSSDFFQSCQYNDHHQVTVPRWCCFIHSVSSTHLLLLFVPATFNDLKLLSAESGMHASQSEHSRGAPGSKDQCLPAGDVDKLSESLGSSHDSAAPSSAKPPSPDTTPAAGINTSPPGTKCYKLPFYVYNCPIMFLNEQLVNRWTYERPADIYKDLTFNVDPDCSSVGDDGEKRKVSESERWRLLKEGSPDSDLYGDQEELKEHCTLVSEMYLRCFVMGVYQSLRLNHPINAADVDFAVNTLCEEHLPMEVDITHFMHVVCGHLRQFVDKVKLEQMTKEDIDKTIASATLASPAVVDAEHTGSQASPWKHSLPDSESGCYLPLNFPLADLTHPASCEAETSLHDLIRNKFLDTLHKFFRPVPGKTDFRYFYLDQVNLSKNQHTGSVTADSESHGDNTNLSSITDDTEVRTEGRVESMFLPLQGVEGQQNEEDSYSTGSAKDMSTSTSSSVHHDLEQDHDLGDELADSFHPLFLQLTCSVRTSGGKVMKSVMVEKLPTCLGELTECLEGASELDLNQTQITLDMIFLTLPPKEDEEMMKQRPCYNRMTSYTSQYSHASSHGDAENDSDDLDNASSPHEYGMNREVSDPMGELPTNQLQSVTACREKIQWLLTDEISSALRLTLPVTAQTLEMVATHVNNTQDQPGCITEQVHLKFVYGPEKSQAPFIEDFERIHPPGYRLNKEGLYYYLYVDPVMVSTMAHAQAISSALQGLEHLPTPQRSPDVQEGTSHVPLRPSRADRKETGSTVKSPRLSEFFADVTCEDKEMFSDSQIKADDVCGDGVEEGSTAPAAETGAEADRSLPSTDTTSLQNFEVNDKNNVQVTDSASIDAVGSSESTAAVAAASEHPSHDDNDAEMFSSKDIKISLIRPSPVKEVHKTIFSGAESDQPPADQAVTSGSASAEAGITRPDLKRQFNVVQLPDAVERQLSDEVFKEDCGERGRFSSGEQKTDQGIIPSKCLSDSSHLLAQVDRSSNIKRVKSSASFEKYKSEKLHDVSKMPHSGTPCRVGSSVGGVNTPQARSSGHQTPSRHNLPSGIDTPLSAMETASRYSGFDDGYDGGSSDSDEDGAMMSFSETRLMRQILPKFWLILRVTESAVHVYFHTRDYGEQLTISAEEGRDVPEILHQMELYKLVVGEISHICHVTNQKLLLDELYGTRMCNTLLVPEADEDQRWTDKYSRRDSDESENDSPRDNYLAAKTQFIPGFFACQQVWSETFTLHPRLKSATSRAGSSVGIHALKSVLNKFSVTNRKNLFVVKENSGAVFYLRLSEASEVATAGSHVSSEVPQPDEDTLAGVSRSSSILSIPPKKVSEVGDEAMMISGRKMSSPVGELEATESSCSISVSKTMLPSGNKSKVEVVTLSAHGICDVGKEIRIDLVQLLQRKLGDAVLDMLTLTLSRNPMSKLTSEDVTFIQLPQSSPGTILQLTIPSIALDKLFALFYYLRQNLLHLFYTPKYMDNACMFSVWDAMGNQQPIPEDNVFLFNKTQQSGGKVGGSGIALVQLSLVDGSGAAITMIPHPKPAMTHEALIQINELDSIVASSSYTRDENQKGPGAMALVQYSIWERGQVDLGQLRERLHQVTLQAVCDVVMEYHLLPTPLCSIPPRLRSLSTATSLPSSPAMVTMEKQTVSSTASSATQPESVTVKPSTRGVHTPKEKSSFSTFVSYLTKSTSVGTPKDVAMDPSAGSAGGQSAGGQSAGGQSGVSSTMDEGEWRQRIEAEHALEPYETGERGLLSPVYQHTMRPWLDFSHTRIGSPCVTRTIQCLNSRFPTDYILKELPSLVKNISQDTTLQVFKCGFDNQYYHYIPARAPVVAKEDKTESSLDLTGTMTSCQLPGGRCSYLAVGRNVQQWRASIDYHHPFSEEAIPRSRTLSKSSGSKALQRFRAHVRGSHTQATGSLEKVAAGEKSEPEYIPRQRLLFLDISDKKLVLYTYNWSSDTSTSLERQFTRLIQWHNARCHLLHCIISQKMGLFWHHIFCDHSHEPLSQDAFTPSVMDIDGLVKYTSPPPTQQTQKTRHRSGSFVSAMRPASLYHASSQAPPSHVPSSSAPPALSPAFPVFDEMYRETRPLVPMHKSSYANLKDPIHRHGAQFLELRGIEKKEREKRDKLVNIYLTWQQRLNNRPIEEDVLELLKNSSRLIHCVSSPILFSPRWRKQLLSKDDPPKKLDSEVSDTSSKSRSRHGSGTSGKSKRSDSVDSRSKKQSGSDSTDMSPGVQCQEEPWHIELRAEFIRQYMQYLQYLGFVPVQVNSSDSKRSVVRNIRQSVDKKRAEDPLYTTPGNTPTSAHACNIIRFAKPAYSYLQKTFPGGIMLLELGFQEVFFSIHVYALESSGLPIGKTINTSLAHIFTDECDKFKDLTHVHSFTHDFHLRAIQAYISLERYQIIQRKHYNITAFLRDFVESCPYSPSFARNYVLEGVVQVDNTNSPGHQLFEYMQNTEKLHGMRPVRMTPLRDDDSDQDFDNALVMQLGPREAERSSSPPIAPLGDYNMGLVVAHDPTPSQSPSTKPGEVMSLRLKYWIIVTNKRDLFPMAKLEKKLGVFKSARTFPAKGPERLPTSEQGFVTSEAEQVIPEPVSPPIGVNAPLPVSAHIGVRQEPYRIPQEYPQKLYQSTNYLGFSNADHTPALTLLKQESARVREMINHVVEETVERCRRDSLWHRMLLSMNEDVDKGRRHRPSDEDFKDPLMNKLTFTEFQELLTLVTKVKLSDIDPNLNLLRSLSPILYPGMISALSQRFPVEKRHFISSDGLKQHLVVLNPNYLDTFLMFTLNSHANYTEVCAVYKEPPSEEEHTPSSPNLPLLATQTRMESFVNTCCYYLWTTLL